MILSRICRFGCIVVIGWSAPVVAQEGPVLLGPVNAAISTPLGQGLDLVHGAEPLGKSRFRFRALNRSQVVNHPATGTGRSFTGKYGLSYGLSPSLDFGLLIPLYMDSIGSLSKYGTGDLVATIKWSRSPQLASPFHSALHVLIGLPLGYTGQHALDRDGAVRRYSNEAIDMGLQYLMDMHSGPTSLYLNGGYFTSGHAEVPAEISCGVGLEYGRTSSWGSVNVEYHSRMPLAEQSRAAAALKVGARIRVARGVELELNREMGFLNHPSGGIFTFGVRLHGYLTGGRRLESRHLVYRAAPIVKGDYAPQKILRVAVVSFDGFEDYRAGERLVDKIKGRLEPHDSIQVVNLSRFANIPRSGFLRPQEALELAQKLRVDVVLTGRVEQFTINRLGGRAIPYLVNFPEAQVELQLRYRVVEYSPQGEYQTFSHRVDGRGILRQRPVFFHDGPRDITSVPSAREIVDVQEAALDDLVANLLSTLTAEYDWLPPEFAL